MMRYWLPPSVVDNACTGVGAVTAAVKTTVLPVFVKALVLMLCAPRYARGNHRVLEYVDLRLQSGFNLVLQGHALFVVD